MVGCVLVKDKRIIGESWHEQAGKDHAEIRALKLAGAEASGATAYVSLEPCSHHGHTPPCTEALIEAGIQRVVVASLDPNPQVNGTGVERLREAGVDVLIGTLSEEAETQNEVFRTTQLESRPFVLYKTAMTLDGKIATRTGQSRWITGEAARKRAQAWRSELDAIAVGINTVLLDDPLLTARGAGSRTPIKVIFDSIARTPTTAHLFDPDQNNHCAQVIIFVTAKASAERIDTLRKVGAKVIEVPEKQGRPNVTFALAVLLKLGVQSLLLEGGGTIAWSFFQAEAVDRIAWFIGPKLLGGGGASPLGGLGITKMDQAIPLDIHTEMVGEDLLIMGRRKRDCQGQKEERGEPCSRVSLKR
jgi:diaminohydroxyphosphoribosylaminopyrimidine deaminase/5-amino-6-(5-phosphoribosylamino)uracil reductase